MTATWRAQTRIVREVRDLTLGMTDAFAKLLYRDCVITLRGVSNRYSEG